jgi:hypothetical protein
MTVKIMNDEAVIFGSLFIHYLGNSHAAVKSVVVIYNDSSGDQTGPQPVQNISCRIIYIHVDVTKAKSPVADQVSAVLRKNALKNVDLIEIETSDQTQDCALTRIGVLPAKINRIPWPSPNNALERIAEVDRIVDSHEFAPSGNQGSRTSRPDAYFNHVSIGELRSFSDQLPEFVTTVSVYQRVASDQRMNVFKFLVGEPGRIGSARKDLGVSDARGMGRQFLYLKTGPGRLFSQVASP